MQEVFDEIRGQIHELRNLIAPFDLRLASLDQNISAARGLFEKRTTAIETKMRVNEIRLDEQDNKIADIREDYVHLSERVKQLVLALNHPKPESSMSLPVREDKSAPAILPPQNPAT